MLNLSIRLAEKFIQVFLYMFKIFYLWFIYFYVWLQWVFVAPRGLFVSCGEQRLLSGCGASLVVSTPVAEHGL